MEPLPADSPLRRCDNALLIPHMGGPTTDLRKFITRELLLESHRYLTRGGALPHEILKETAMTMSRS